MVKFARLQFDYLRVIVLMNRFARLLSCIFLVLLMLGFVMQPAFAARSNFDDVDYYDCADKPDGSYEHPSDYTRFIVCHNGRAADMACPDCELNNVDGCAKSAYLFFDESKQQCELPKLVQHDSSTLEK